MHKRFVSIAAVLLLVFSSTEAMAEGLMPTKRTGVPYINARCAIAMDSKTKIVLYESNSDMVVPMASTTKIITALVALKYGNLDKKVEISERAANIRGSTVGFKKGEQVSLRELVYGLMLKSGNDAAIAIAEGMSGSVDEFLKLMNEFACHIGLTDTHFESPHGLDSENHYTTAYDLALLTSKAKEIKEFNDIVGSKDVDGGSMGFTRNYHNINKLLWQIPTANGVKTGYTGQAGKCLVSSISYDGRDIIIVVLNCTARWKETKSIYDYIVKQYEYRKITSKDDVIESIPVYRGKGKADLKCTEDIVVPVKKSSYLTKKVSYPSNVPAPIFRGDKLGSLEVYEDNKLIYSTTLESNNCILRKGKLRSIFK